MATATTNTNTVRFIVESDIILRSVDKPFTERQPIASFATYDMAYEYIHKYLADTKNLHTYFSRQYICSLGECEKRINESRIIAINTVLGQFEDMLYIVEDSINTVTTEHK